MHRFNYYTISHRYKHYDILCMCGITVSQIDVLIYFFRPQCLINLPITYNQEINE